MAAHLATRAATPPHSTCIPAASECHWVPGAGCGRRGAAVGYEKWPALMQTPCWRYRGAPAVHGSALGTTGAPCFRCTYCASPGAPGISIQVRLASPEVHLMRAVLVKAHLSVADIEPLV
jgi:hypothetical protein